MKQWDLVECSSNHDTIRVFDINGIIDEPSINRKPNVALSIPSKMSIVEGSTGVGYIFCPSELIIENQRLH